MTPHIVRSSSNPLSLGPLGPFLSAWHNRGLIIRLTRREIEARYRGSSLGLLWSVIVPLLMLAVYTFVFSVVFQARWGTTGEMSRAQFAMIVFSGLIVFSFFSECLTRAPSLMLENVPYIKKVIFPLEIMPWITVAVALFNAAASFTVLMLLYVALLGVPPLSALLFPFLMVPLILLSFGATAFISSVGVYLRDIKQFVGVFVTLLMFLSPIFYPVSAVPERLRYLTYFNPLTLLLDQTRQFLFWGEFPDIRHGTFLGIYLLGTWICSWAGYVWFMKTKKGFADVI